MDEYVPKKDRDTRWYIWNKKYLCRLPYINTLSIEYIQYFGMPASGDPATDKEMTNELVYRMLSVNEMMEFYNQGVNVSVCNVPDTAKIYEDITRHLMAWKDHLETSLFVQDPPIEDLVKLDQFANVIYAHAKYQFTHEIATSLLAKKMQSLRRITLRPPVIPTAESVEKPESNDKYPERQSLASIFTRRKRVGVGKWN